MVVAWWVVVVGNGKSRGCGDDDLSGGVCGVRMVKVVGKYEWCCDSRGFGESTIWW